MYSLMQAISLVLGLVYFDQTYDQKGVMNINGCLFLMQMQMTFGNTFGIVNVSFLFCYCICAVYKSFTYGACFRKRCMYTLFEQHNRNLAVIRCAG